MPDQPNHACRDLASIGCAKRCFYSNGSNSGVQGFYVKPTTHTADALAADDATRELPSTALGLGRQADRQAKSASCSYFSLRALTLSQVVVVVADSIGKRRLDRECHMQAQPAAAATR